MTLIGGWFRPEVHYSGEGQASLEAPECVVEGPATVSVSETGVMACRVKIEQHNLPSDLPLDLALMGSAVTSGVTGTTKWREVRIDVGSVANRCREFVVRNDAGDRFWFDDLVDYVPQIASNLTGAADSEASLRLRPLRAQYEATGTSASQHRYWVLPLLNFVSNFGVTPPNQPAELVGHPLRLDTSASLIVFPFEGEGAFIEPLPDYEDRVRMLANGDQTAVVTAIMVATIGQQTVDMASYRDWLPVKFLSLLSLASGGIVGAPWIELRDCNGNLCRRLHVSLSVPQSVRGSRGAFDEKLLPNATGKLLVRAMTSKPFIESNLELFIRRHIRSRSPVFTLDERLGLLFLSIEGLCQLINPMAEQSAWDSLGQNQKGKVTRALKPAAKKIRQAIAEAKKHGLDDEVMALEAILRSTERSKNAKVGTFAEKVTALFSIAAPHDAEIADQYFARHPTGRGTDSWLGVIGELRNNVVHNAFFDIRSGRYDALELWWISRHLDDILVRTFLVLLNYAGHYQPVVSVETDLRPVSWVDPGTNAERLGYGRKT